MHSKCVVASFELEACKLHSRWDQLSMLSLRKDCHWLDCSQRDSLVQQLQLQGHDEVICV